MKNKLWLYQLPFVLLCTFAFYVTELGTEGRIENRFMRESLYPGLRRVSTIFSDLKFRLRGVQPPRNKVVIVEIDDEAVKRLGRWPWHRDVLAYLIDQTMKAGAKVVGLDIVFSEHDQRVSDELEKILLQNHLVGIKNQLETDPILQSAIQTYADRLVLGWAPDIRCQPLYDGVDACPVKDPEFLKAYPFPQGFEKFAFDLQVPAPQNFDVMKTPVITAASLLTNLAEYNQVAQYSGNFASTPDSDGVSRRLPLLMMAEGRAFPSLALAMARVGLKEKLEIRFDNELRVSELKMGNSGQRIPVTPVGAVEVNFRGPGRTFNYVSAAEVMSWDPNAQPTTAPAAPSSNDAPVSATASRMLASTGAFNPEVLKDAYVLMGVSAMGANDIRAFPFDSYVPGVEGHAYILDNILSGDFLTRGSGTTDPRWLYCVMVLGGVLFAFATQKLEAIPALFLTLGSFMGMALFDLKVLFAHNILWNTSFLAMEMMSIFIFTMAAKYVMEERNKKFVRSAFAKYVAPAVVDSIMKDPKKLTVGGEKRDLTILFSDIRGFTTFSEKMDAKALSSFLNEYLEIMTKIVFANEGTLDKYIGDAIMAFWGAPLDQPKHAENACRAATQMMQALAHNKARFREQYGVEVDIGIGVNSGNVSVGNMGSMNNFSYTVIGDHVNLASRLEGLTKYYGASIVTSRFTFEFLQKAGASHLPHRVLDFVKVKGKKNAVELIQVLDREMSTEGLRFFDEARAAYSAQRWAEAVGLFKRANELLMGEGAARGEVDGPCREYLDRCEAFRIQPPGVNWDGSWEMHSK